jgi:predicted ATPase/DNA-binding CsgD family transcriptional regulator
MVTTSPIPPHRPLLVPRDRFVGRSAELATIDALLADPAVPLVTLTGPAGVGKSRLALRAAELRRATYSAGVAVVPLWRERSAVGVLAAIARALRCPQHGTGSLFERLVDHLQEGRLLLVLDGLDRLTDAGPILADLLAACPPVQALGTSRMPLRIAGERELPVCPLPLPIDSALGENESVALFLARAWTIEPDLGLNARTAAVIAAICRRLDGLPLAIELAAAQTRALSLGEIRARLDAPTGRLALLEGGGRDLPERHRSLREALAWSYDVLPLPARVLFRRLAVCEEGWSLDLAAALLRSHASADSADDPAAPVAPGGPAAPRPAILAALTPLLDHGLVRRVGGAATGDESRYAMLETVRDFALDRLTREGDPRDAERRHAAGCLALAEAAAVGLDGSDRGAWLRRLARERANLSAALSRLHAAGDGLNGLRLAGALGGFWATSGRFGDARWLDVFLDLDDAGSSDPIAARARARAMRWAGQFASLQGQHKRAIGLLRDALCHYRAVGDRGSATVVAGELAVAYLWQGSPESVDRAITFLDQAIALHREQGDERRMALLQIYQGFAIGRRRAGDGGARRIEEAEEVCRAIGGERCAEVGVALLCRGWLALAAGERAPARALLDECRALTEELGCETTRTAAVAGLGWEALGRNDRGGAIRWLRLGLTGDDRLAYRLGLAVSLAGVVTLAAWEGGDPSRIAGLVGAVEGLGVDRRLFLDGEPERAYRQAVEAIGAALGPTELERSRTAGQRTSIERAVAGALALLDGLAGGARGLPPGAPRLTPREADVLRLLADRLMNQEIADQLGTKVRTIETHVQHVCDKLGVTRRREAVQRARELGLL